MMTKRSRRPDDDRPTLGSLGASRLMIFVVLGLSALASSAHAAAPLATLELAREDGIMWAEAKVGEGDAETITIKFFAPRPRRDGHELWQTCRSPYTAPGTYRCGVDVSSGSPARERQGPWRVKVLIDGNVADRARFSL